VAVVEGDRATTAIWELEIFWWQAELKGERATFFPALPGKCETWSVNYWNFE